MWHRVAAMAPRRGGAARGHRSRRAGLVALVVAAMHFGAAKDIRLSFVCPLELRQLRDDLR
jgi:hypothetical protein